ncbi:MAG: molybdate ABC transporter substrate-binding protein [Stenotrophobium sp.]
MKRITLIVMTLIPAISMTSFTAKAETANVAVAANFIETARTIEPQFEQLTGQQVRFSSASTGAHDAQIRHGAPFDAWLAADEAHPAALEQEGLAVAGTRFTYAVGKLALWSTTRASLDEKSLGNLASADKLAIANPQLAPYGAAAQAVLQKLGLWTALQAHLVTGQNIGQTLEFVASGSAAMGFVAYSEIRGKAGVSWLPPQDLYPLLVQQAVLLKHGAGNAAAIAWLNFLHNKARPAIREAGYGTPEE